ncbi:pyridoxal phosphate-dependent transferase [Podospora aff. communis PSN243]|uniref:Pyridoxal phosphate-dependent transferase n=1 Tax=Podospora aff. communis PSN243 TaxID=3040156 RepID=A0AAV9GQJ6_9PEZI|nr:pyridoxal phosphate-dependent transferase [Podospora aff. communis PSN243]
MDSKGFREAAVSSIDEIIKYYDNISERPVKSTVEPGYLRKLLPSAAPEDGEAWSDIQQDIEAKIMPGITHWQHPSFHAFFPCASSYPSILGELYSAALSGAAFNWICSPAVTELETIVLDWLAKLLGLPECFLSTGSTNGGGVIQGSASEAVLTAMVAAREKYLTETVPSSLEGDVREDAIALKRSRMVALATSATHSSTKKAALILGVRFIAIPVTSETNYALTGPILAAALETCRARNLEPFFLTATLGTTDTCAVDDFSSISATLSFSPSGSKIWVHIDAAYAGAALVCPEHQTAVSLPSITTFHSFNMNMHKWLLTNFDASCLYVRDRAWFIRALTINQAVYANAPSQGGLVTDYREWQIPLGRRFRALKIWFVLRSYGAAGLRSYIRRTVAYGEEFASWVRERGDIFEILTPPAFALTVFRMTGRDEEEANRRTKELERRMDGSGKMWVTSTVLEGRFAIRVVTSVWKTEREDVERAFGLIVGWAGEILELS